ncbi:hypothetical protein GCM10017714_34300 [Curtobacterium pusillum]|nr:hypothetical protein GCM10017610_18210 [Curtobacterium pusillum]
MSDVVIVPGGSVGAAPAAVAVNVALAPASNVAAARRESARRPLLRGPDMGFPFFRWCTSSWLSVVEFGSVVLWSLKHIGRLMSIVICANFAKHE